MQKETKTGNKTKKNKGEHNVDQKRRGKERRKKKYYKNHNFFFFFLVLQNSIGFDLSHRERERNDEN